MQTLASCRAFSCKCLKISRALRGRAIAGLRGINRAARFTDRMWGISESKVCIVCGEGAEVHCNKSLGELTTY